MDELRVEPIKVKHRKREATVEGEVVRWARQRGIWVVKFTAFNERGLPDRLFVFEGNHVYIEFKRPGERPTETQYRKMEQMRDHGCRVAWFDNADDAIDYLQYCYFCSGATRLPDAPWPR